MDRRRRIRVVVDLGLLALVLTLLGLRLWVYRPVQVVQDSMEPTLYQGDQLLVNTWRIRSKLPPRGTVVVLVPPRETDWVVKRIAGVPGDTVQLDEGGLRVNGRRLRESYIRPYGAEVTPPVRVKPGTVFVLGDNRGRSNDSRDFGLVPQAAIIGEAVAVLAPRSHRRWLSPATALRLAGAR